MRYRVRHMTLLGFLLFLLAFSACNESTGSPDGDTPPDGDDDTILDGDASDLCSGAAVDCTPGTCIVRDGKARCDCPEDYHAERYNCVPDAVTDGDMDSDAPIDGDTPDGDGADSDTDDGIPNCTAANDIFPCRADLPLEIDEETGEFSILVKSSRGYSVDVWENWAIATIFLTSDCYPIGGGGFLINFATGEIYKYYNQGAGDIYPVINDGHAMWAEIDGGATSSDSDDTSVLHVLDLNQLKDVIVSKSKTFKWGLQYESGFPYWLDSRTRVGARGNGIYSLDEGGQEIRIDKVDSGDGAFDFTVYGRILAFVTIDGRIGVVERPSFQPRWLDVPVDVYLRLYPEIFGTKIFYSDNRESPNTDPTKNPCWTSLYEYDLDLDKESVLHKNIDGKDYRIEDVWENWVLYSYYAEGNHATDDPELQYCGVSKADADLFLRYLPTGEEWNITNHLGNQHYASMWGARVVWLDTRENLDPTYGYGNFYGIDLCKHPELKSRFAECAQREEAN